MLLDNQNDYSTSDVQRIASHLRENGIPHTGLYKKTSQKLVLLAMEIADQAQKRLEKQYETIKKLENLTRTDELTGLLNRRGFDERLAHTLANSRRFNDEGFLVYVDLDHFKPINDTFGHLAGDEVLKQAANILKACVRKGDEVARIGGDEFAIIMPRVKHSSGIAQARRIERTLNSAYVSWEGNLISIKASFGVQPFSGTDETTDVLADADNAMYRAKQERKTIRNNAIV